MPSVTVEAFVIDDVNEAKFWSHGLSREAVLEVLGNRRVVTRNRKGRAADYPLMRPRRPQSLPDDPDPPNLGPVNLGDQSRLALQAGRGRKAAVAMSRKCQWPPTMTIDFASLSDDEEREFMDPETWDWDSIEELPPVPNPSAVLPVRFSLDEMRRVGQAAEAEGLLDLRVHQAIHADARDATAPILARLLAASALLSPLLLFAQKRTRLGRELTQEERAEAGASVAAGRSRAA